MVILATTHVQTGYCQSLEHNHHWPRRRLPLVHRSRVLSLKGVLSTKQGWFSSTPPNENPSEGVLIEFEPPLIGLRDIVDIHVQTHSATNKHSKRDKYRSAIYTQNQQDKNAVLSIINAISNKEKAPLIVEVLPLIEFTIQPNQNYLNYFYNQPKKPFCQTYIAPKLKKLIATHSKNIKQECRDVIKKSI